MPRWGNSIPELDFDCSIVLHYIGLRYWNPHGYLGLIRGDAFKCPNKISTEAACSKGLFKNIECCHQMESRQTTDKNKKGWNN